MTADEQLHLFRPLGLTSDEPDRPYDPIVRHHAKAIIAIRREERRIEALMRQSGAQPISRVLEVQGPVCAPFGEIGRRSPFETDDDERVLVTC